MFYGKVFGAAFGPTSAMILAIKGAFFGGGLLARIFVRPQYAERFLAVFVNGVFIQCARVDEKGVLECVVPAMADGESINSFWCEDIGALSELAEDVLPYVAAQARANDALTANRLNIVWDNSDKYKLTGVNGDSQLSSIVITGAERGKNCSPLPLKKTRARLHYSIQPIDDENSYLRWFDGNRLVSSGLAGILQPNLLSARFAFDDAAWTKTVAVVTADSTTDADGGTRADTLTETNTNNNHGVSQAFTAVNGTQYEYVVYAKNGDRRYIHLQINDSGVHRASFDLQTGAVTLQSGCVATITSAGSGWYKCSIVFTPNATACTAYIRMATDGLGGSGDTLYVGTSKYVYLYKASIRKTAAGIAVVCDEVDGSGLSVACNFTYTGAVNKGDAFLDVKWPALYRIFYSTSVINYAGAHQAEVEDSGGVSFNYISGERASGDYYYNVVSVDDEGDVETGMTDLGPEEIFAPPEAASDFIVTQPSPFTSLAIAFTPGDVLADHTIYSSNFEEPINFGDMTSGPAPVVVSAGNTFGLIPIPDYPHAQRDDEPAYDTLAAAWDAAVATASAAYTFAAFEAALSTLTAAVESALATFSDSVTFALAAKKDTLAAAGTQAVANLAPYLTDSDAFDAYAGTVYGAYLQTLGLMLEDNPARYALPDGTTAGVGTLGTTDKSLYDIVQPFKKRNIFYAVVRATLAGVEERSDQLIEIEMDDSGANLLTARPAKAFIVSYDIDGTDITVRAGVVDDNSEDATILDLYVLTEAATFDPTTPTQSQNLPAAVKGYHEVTFDAETLTANTWHKLAVMARTADGARSELYDFTRVYAGTDAPVAPGNIKAYVVRSKGGV